MYTNDQNKNIDTCHISSAAFSHFSNNGQTCRPMSNIFLLLQGTSCINALFKLTTHLQMSKELDTLAFSEAKCFYFSIFCLLERNNPKCMPMIYHVQPLSHFPNDVLGTC